MTTERDIAAAIADAFATEAAAVSAAIDALAEQDADPFAGLDVPFTDGSNS